MTLIDRVKGKFSLGFGGAAVSGEGAGYGFGDITESGARELLELAKASGIRVFDTAPIYGFGLSEKRIGRTFKKLREEVFIISKSGVTWGENKRVDMSNDPRVTRKMLEQSLRDLDSEYIDLYMIHWPDESVDIRRTLEVLEKAKEEKKIKHIGLCNTHREDLEKAKEVCHIEAVQGQLNIFEQDSLSLFDFLKEESISFMSWGTLDKGILTGTVNKKRSFDSTDCRSWAPWWKAIDKEKRYKKVEVIEKCLEDSGHTKLELAVGFNLSLIGVSMALCGMRTPEQLKSILNATKNLPSKELIDKVLSELKIKDES